MLWRNCRPYFPPLIPISSLEDWNSYRLDWFIIKKIKCPQFLTQVEYPTEVPSYDFVSHQKRVNQYQSHLNAEKIRLLTETCDKELVCFWWCGSLVTCPELVTSTHVLNFLTKHAGVLSTQIELKCGPLLRRSINNYYTKNLNNNLVGEDFFF